MNTAFIKITMRETTLLFFAFCSNTILLKQFMFHAISVYYEKPALYTVMINVSNRYTLHSRHLVLYV